MAGLIQTLRSGDWLIRERIMVVSAAVLIAAAVAVAFLVATANGFNDFKGRPLGTDFSSFYAAGTFVLDGQPTEPFDPSAHHRREQAIFGAATPFYSFSYPPIFLFVAAALALMPYPLALVVWQGTTLGLYLAAMWRIVGWIASRRNGAGDVSPPASRLASPPFRADAIWLLPALAFPAVFINLGHGQNGFLTAGLFGLALALLERRPIAAGLLFGLIAYKPQLGLMLPFALAAGGHWRTFAAATATVAVLLLATLVAFGPDVWRAFLASTPFTRVVMLEQGDVGWYKIQSVFSWTRMWGGSVALAYAVQGACAIAIAGLLVRLWRSPARLAFKAAALMIASLLATPFILDYDLMVLAPAIGFLAADGRARGFFPWEKSLLAALWIVPLVARSFAQALMIPLAVPVMFAALALTLRHGMPARDDDPAY